ncbi:MAG: hypothetical protein RIC03_07015 [Cyclobacteriaceae bacterium]
MNNLTVYRSGVVVSTIEIDEKTIYEKELMGIDKITCEVTVSKKIDFQINDYVEYEGERYSIKEAPDMDKLSSNEFSYVIGFYGQAYELYNKILRDEGRSRFSYSGTPLEFIGLIVKNLQEIDITWAVGTVAALSDVITLTFDEQSCRTALTQIAQSFDLEYTFEQGETSGVPFKKINLLIEAGETKALTFQYGRGNGLYGLRRTPLDDPFATVWYGYGGGKNIPVSYRDNLGRLTFDNSPIEVNVAIYGRIEGSITFEDVFPNRTADVTATAAPTEISDNTLDFDLNGKFLTEQSLRVVFKSGDLNGNEFVVRDYNHNSKTITLHANEDENGYILPNDVVKPSVGDSYTLIGLDLPESYITAAETLLEQKVQAHAQANSAPKVSYDLLMNEKYIAANELALQLQPGDRVRVIDVDVQVDNDLRIRYVTWPLVNNRLVEVTISEEEIYSWDERVARDIKSTESVLDETVRIANLTRNLADEISRAAVIQQFSRTYIGDLAVLSGAFVVGNPESGAVAGMSGTGALATAIRFFAGSSYDDRATAPFRVQNDGKAFASGLQVAEGSLLSIFKVLADGLEIAAAAGDNNKSLLSTLGLAMKSEAYDFINISHRVSAGGASQVFTKAVIQGILESGAAGASTNLLAGIIGMTDDEMAEINAYDQLFGGSNKNEFGGIFSSIKNVGSQHQAIQQTSVGAGTLYTVGYNEHTVIINDTLSPNIATVILPNKPGNGMMVYIKNFTSTSKTIQVAGAPLVVFDDIVLLDNTVASSFTLATGEAVQLQYDQSLNYYFILSVS